MPVETCSAPADAQIMYIPENPLIVQSDRSVLFEVHSLKAVALAWSPFIKLLKISKHKV